MEGPRSGKSFRSLGWTGRGCRRVGWGWEHEGWRRPSWGAEKGINSCWTETLEGTGYGIIVYTTHKTHKYVCIYLYVCMYDVYIYLILPFSEESAALLTPEPWHKHVYVQRQIPYHDVWNKCWVVFSRVWLKNYAQKLNYPGRDQA